MPPRQVTRGRVEEPSYVRSVFGALTSADNRSVVTAVGLFAAGVAFLHSSWSEILIPL
ncbi:putative TOM core complex subunit Tom6 [Cenococcum geophilum 1.58]|uniref:putative TOM core complex subunit Tom6 n=1 Tax=Cenococcum geophilum 1.58 TaxID=794803 RepID=UPI00358E8E38|nr:putative TOM core complex subunit Tom6 [Cenococcum geophilum 1.58]